MNRGMREGKNAVPQTRTSIFAYANPAFFNIFLDFRVLREYTDWACANAHFMPPSHYRQVDVRQAVMPAASQLIIYY